MADIQLRFHKDMLVLSAPLDATLAKQGIAVEFDRQYLNLVEQDSLEDALRLESVAGAQVLVTATADITPARLAHARMEGDLQKVAEAALGVVQALKPQHVLVEIGPCGLPLDPSSKASLNENRDQYARAARAFQDGGFDGFLLDGFTSIDDMRCALMGVRQVSDRPIFASMLIGASGSVQVEAAPAAVPQSDFDVRDINSGLPSDGYAVLDNPLDPLSRRSQVPLDPSQWPQAVAMMEDLEAAVIGFETAEPLDSALDYAQQAAQATDLPLMAALRVVTDPLAARDLGLVPLEELVEYTPDTLVLAGERLRGAGIQFLRATGDATAACTAALVAAVAGQDALR